MFERLRCDVIDAIRGLKTSPLILIATVVTLGASIGMNVAMFGLVDRALLSPPRHIRQPDRLVSLGIRPPGGDEHGGVMTTTSYVAFRTVRDQVPALSGAAAWQRGPASVGVDGDQIRADTRLV